MPYEAHLEGTDLGGLDAFLDLMDDDVEVVSRIAAIEGDLVATTGLAAGGRAGSTPFPTTASTSSRWPYLRPHTHPAGQHSRGLMPAEDFGASSAGPSRRWPSVGAACKEIVYGS